MVISRGARAQNMAYRVMAERMAHRQRIVASMKISISASDSGGGET